MDRYRPRRIACAPRLAALLAAAAVAVCGNVCAGEPPPITTLGGPVGDLLRTWHAEGTAAGNAGDWYDNRDRGHSRFDVGLFPQLSTVEYSEHERARGLDWAFQGRALPHLVFGNSSTSAGVTTGGSNPRMAYSHPRGLAVLCEQYTRNNIYVYPEHRDHDPGHNGRPDGFGDLYPTTTPYLIISQGSSGSDQPFLRAIAATLAAFRPAVKRKLVETGLVAPTVQLILRATSKRLAGPQDYLTGTGHPTVFDGSWIDEQAMVAMAHDIPLEAVPPVVRLRAVEEDRAERGRDFFDVWDDESLADTPAVIARIHRSVARDRRIAVSAEESYDVNGRPLTFSWALLRGDPARVRLTPRGERGAACEVRVSWHERRPIAEGTPLASNRVDIGIFAHNGASWSAPAFITFFSLDDEARAYADDGRVLSVTYGAGTTHAVVADWNALGALLRSEPSTLGARLLREALEPSGGGERIAAILRAIDGLAETPRREIDASVRTATESALADLAAQPKLWEKIGGEVQAMVAADPSRAAAVKAARRRFDASESVERFNGEILESVVFAGAARFTYERNYVDGRIATAKSWRDVYRYGPAGEIEGWTRLDPTGPTEFTREGFLVLAQDFEGRCARAQAVRYEREGTGAPGRATSSGTLRVVPGERTYRYEYAGDNDRRGRAVPER
jgi:hypothetical protein